MSPVQLSRAAKAPIPVQRTLGSLRDHLQFLENQGFLYAVLPMELIPSYQSNKDFLLKQECGILIKMEEGVSSWPLLAWSLALVFTLVLSQVLGLRPFMSTLADPTQSTPGLAETDTPGQGEAIGHRTRITPKARMSWCRLGIPVLLDCVIN